MNTYLLQKLTVAAGITLGCLILPDQLVQAASFNFSTGSPDGKAEDWY